MTFVLTQNIKMLNPYSSVDSRYGVYNSIEEAKAAVDIAIRKEGLTVGIIEDGKVVEYWWNTSDLSDNGLVRKTAETTEKKYYLKKSILDIKDSDFGSEESIINIFGTVEEITQALENNYKIISPLYYNEMYGGTTVSEVTSNVVTSLTPPDAKSYVITFITGGLSLEFASKIDIALIISNNKYVIGQCGILTIAFQPVNDINLPTTDKTIVGAIKELNNEKFDNPKGTNKQYVAGDGSLIDFPEISVGEEQVQSDWNETDSSSKAYIKNKPTIPNKVSQLQNDSKFVNETQLSEAINNIEIGGTNLLEDSQKERSCTYNQTRIQIPISVEKMKALKGKNATASLKIRGTGTTPKCVIYVLAVYSEGNAYYMSPYSYIAKSEYETIDFTKVVADLDSRNVTSAYFVINVGYGGASSDATIYIKEVKIEEGNKATSWSPAPEDKLNTDGSNATEGGTNVQLLKLPIGNTAVKDDTAILTESIDDATRWTRRRVSLVWDYIKSKALPVFRTIKGIEIKANADLNEYLTPGHYYCKLNNTAQTIKNSPSPYAFYFEVEPHAIGQEGVVQKLINYESNSSMFIRNHTTYGTSGWTKWRRISYADEIASTTGYGHVKLETTPTSGSSNAITSGGVFSALSNKLDRLVTITPQDKLEANKMCEVSNKETVMTISVPTGTDDEYMARIIKGSGRITFDGVIKWNNIDLVNELNTSMIGIYEINVQNGYGLIVKY